MCRLSMRLHDILFQSLVMQAQGIGILLWSRLAKPGFLHPRHYRAMDVDVFVFRLA
jgi:hypothetical protein